MVMENNLMKTWGVMRGLHLLILVFLHFSSKQRPLNQHKDNYDRSTILSLSYFLAEIIGLTS